MVGDRWRDMQAGRQAGCRTLWINNGYLEQQPLEYDFSVGSLAEAAAVILGQAI
jgi:D-glycero-D-manno-heptose 1,7-bisphosphate phosphatase